MLVLNRKVGERILIGAGVVVKVVAIVGQNVRLGIEAAQSVPIWREERARSQDSAGPHPTETAPKGTE